jgi:hypothetical protein
VALSLTEGGKGDCVFRISNSVEQRITRRSHIEPPICHQSKQFPSFTSFLFACLFLHSFLSLFHFFLPSITATALFVLHSQFPFTYTCLALSTTRLSLFQSTEGPIRVVRILKEMEKGTIFPLESVRRSYLLFLSIELIFRNSTTFQFSGSGRSECCIQSGRYPTLRLVLFVCTSRDPSEWEVFVNKIKK